MFKQLSILEVKAGEDRFHRYECPPNSPLGEIHDSLCAMRKYVLDLMEEQEKKDEPKKETMEVSDDAKS